MDLEDKKPAMVSKPGKLKATLGKIPSRICGVYTARSKASRAEKLLLVISCLINSLILAILLFLALLVPFKCGFNTTVATTGAFWLGITVAMCLSQRVRCFGTLFLMSIGLKQGRNLLISAGTMVVIFLNIQNILRNLRGLAKSLLCTIEEKLVTVDLPPLKNYIQMLRWVAQQLKTIPTNIFGNFYSDISLKPTVHSQNFTRKMQEAERALNETTERVLGMIETATSAAKTASPVLGVVLLVVLTVLYLRRFSSDPQYDNIFITRNFIKYDRNQHLEGKPSVLPLSRKELRRYVVVPSAGFTRKEAKAMLKFSIPILTYSLGWLFLVGVDALLYWIIITLRRRLEELQPLHVPVALKVEKGAFVGGVAIEGNRKVYNFSYDMPIFEKKCLPEPGLWLHKSLTPLLVIVGVLVLLALVSSKLDQLRILVSEQFFSGQAAERIAALHMEILRRRSKWKVQTAETPLKSFATQLRFWLPILFLHEQNSPQSII